MSAAVLACEELTVRYGGSARAAVEDVGLELRSGATLALVGASGSGKSTLLRALLLLETPERGRVLFEGRALRGVGGGPRLRRAEELAFRAAVQPVFQDPGTSLDPRLTIGEAIAEGARIHLGLRGEALREAVAAGLRRVGLASALASRRPHELSGGQRQRVALARALAPGPRVLLLDEPTSALDATVQSRMVALLRRLIAELDLAVLLVTHDLALARGLADRVAVIESGRIVESGAAADLYASPRHPYTQALLRAAERRRPEAGPREE